MQFYCFGKWWVTLLLLICLVGCPAQKKSESKKPVEDESKRPAIRVTLVGSPELAEAMKRRWQGTSQQPIELSTIDESSLLAIKELKADVLIFPGRLIGELAERKWLNPLPNKLLERVNIGGDETSWSPAWQKQVAYGKRSWGVPLGLSVPLVVQRSPSDESKLNWSLSELQSRAKGPPPNQSDKPSIDHDAMIDRFLMILASQTQVSPNMGVFFQLRDAKPRLTEPEFLKAAEEFSKCASLAPTLWTGSHEHAWTSVLAGEASWSIGIPNGTQDPSRGTSKAASIEANSISVGRIQELVALRSAPIIIDSGSGLVASVTSTTRQSAVSNYMLEWLDQNDQREALVRESPWIATRSLVTSSNPANRNDIVAYQRQLNQSIAQGIILNELRMRGGHRYRDRLGRALTQIVEQPDRIRELLNECRKDWDVISEELGRESQQRSLERTLQLLEAEAL